MAGQKIVARLSTEGDGITNGDGYVVTGLPINVITENGNIQPDDEWALFRLTDDGLSFYKCGRDLAASIMSMLIDEQPAVHEIARLKTQEEAVEARRKLSLEEQRRTLIRSVTPKNN